MSSDCAEPGTGLGAVLEHDGYARICGVVARAVVEALLPSLASAVPAGAAGTRTAWTGSLPLRELLAARHLEDALPGGRSAGWFPTRVILFDKRPEVNWGVPWHQDLAIAVRRRHDVPGFGGWSVKEGVVHVHPPVPVLERMIAARLSLDDCGHYDGALRVLPGTHRRGRLDAATIRRCARDIPAATCPAAAGDLLLMRPLLLHASSPAARPVRRRVLHVEFAREPLPPGLEWLPVSP